MQNRFEEFSRGQFWSLDSFLVLAFVLCWHFFFFSFFLGEVGWFWNRSLGDVCWSVENVKLIKAVELSLSLLASCSSHFEVAELIESLRKALRVLCMSNE